MINTALGSNSGVGSTLLNTIQTNAVMNFRTGNMMLDMIITSLIISLLGYASNLFLKVGEIKESNYFKRFTLFFNRKNSIKIEGERIEVPSKFYSKFDYSYSFKAVIERIKKLNYQSSGIKHLTQCQLDENRNEGNPCDVFIVDQPLYFKIDNDIYCQITKKEDQKDLSGNSGKSTNMISVKYAIEIFSSKKSLTELTNWVDQITNEYLKDVSKARVGKLYIYTLMNIGTEGDSDNWHETPFTSNRNFSNMFSDELSNLKTKLDYFLENPSWYDQIGCPHTFGALLYGPPGTGKTSAIKAIANYTKRHLVVIPLSKIKKSNDLFRIFFERKYTWENRHNLIDFKDKIILFEDIDCMSDIIHKREEDKSSTKSKKNIGNSDEDLSTREMLKILMDGEDDKGKDYVKLMNASAKSDDEITLSFILNLIDGIRETPGRIILMTSNHPEKIDPALIRPGRIDMKVNFGLAGLNSIIKIYKQIYGEEMDEKYYPNIRSNTFSPAEIYNAHFSSKSKEEFIAKISSK